MKINFSYWNSNNSLKNIYNCCQIEFYIIALNCVSESVRQWPTAAILPDFSTGFKVWLHHLSFIPDSEAEEFLRTWSSSAFPLTWLTLTGPRCRCTSSWTTSPSSTSFRTSCSRWQEIRTLRRFTLSVVLHK